MYRFSDQDFMEAHAFHGMPLGVNVDFDRWRLSPVWSIPPLPAMAPRRSTSKRGLQPVGRRIVEARLASVGCAFSKRT